MGGRIRPRLGLGSRRQLVGQGTETSARLGTCRRGTETIVQRIEADGEGRGEQIPTLSTIIFRGY
ncbi:hypothetical protein AKJ16_DCAP26343 [Drosera capensis]